MRTILALTFATLSLLGCGGSDDSPNKGKASINYLTPPEAQFQTFEKIPNNFVSKAPYQFSNPDTGIGIPADLSCKIGPDETNECDYITPDIRRIFDINGQYALVQIANATVEYQDDIVVGDYSFIQDKTSGKLYPMLENGQLRPILIWEEFVSRNKSDNVAYDDAIYQIRFNDTGKGSELVRFQLDGQEKYFVHQSVYIHDSPTNESQIYAFAVDSGNNIALHIGQIKSDEGYFTPRFMFINQNGFEQEQLVHGSYPITLHGDIILKVNKEDKETPKRVIFETDDVILVDVELADHNDFARASTFRGNISRGDYFMDMNGTLFYTANQEFNLIHDQGWYEDCNQHCLYNIATQDYLITLKVWNNGQSTEAIVADVKTGNVEHKTLNFQHGHWDDGYGLIGTIATQHNEFKIVQVRHSDGNRPAEYIEYYYNVETDEEYEIELEGERQSLKVFTFLNP